MPPSAASRKHREGRGLSAESQMTVTTRCNNMFQDANTVTTVTAVSNVSSRNPSPPTQPRNGVVVVNGNSVVNGNGGTPTTMVAAAGVDDNELEL